MNTVILSDSDPKDLQTAADGIREGRLVAFPTETVYGLGANALMEDAAKKIYAAKGRPSDNPLIIHLAKASDAEQYCHTNALYDHLAELYMPGPLTVILPKKEVIPYGVTGGLDTVAVRVPAHPVAHELIARAGVPVAAPSANLSGRPSCTNFHHVLEDMNGRIDMIIDGGNCEIGLESTILSIVGDKVILLRPGKITREMLESQGFRVETDKAVTQKLSDNEKPMAPGMKYRHYAPRAQVYLLDGDDTKVEMYMRSYLNSPEVALIAYDEYTSLADGENVYRIGSMDDRERQGNRLFDLLRELDHHPKIQTVLAKLPASDGFGLAIYNRMLKASGYSILKV